MVATLTLLGLAVGLSVISASGGVLPRLKPEGQICPPVRKCLSLAVVLLHRPWAELGSADEGSRFPRNWRRRCKVIYPPN